MKNIRPEKIHTHSLSLFWRSKNNLFKNITVFNSGIGMTECPEVFNVHDKTCRVIHIKIWGHVSTLMSLSSNLFYLSCHFLSKILFAAYIIYCSFKWILHQLRRASKFQMIYYNNVNKQMKKVNSNSEVPFCLLQWSKDTVMEPYLRPLCLINCLRL